MFRLLGCTLVLAGFCGIGISFCESEEKKIRILKDWGNSVRILKNEIGQKKQPIGPAMQECARRIDGEVGHLWESAAAGLQNTEKSFGEVWRIEFLDYLKKSILPKEGKKEIEDFLYIFGYEEEEIQISMLDVKMEEIEYYQKKLEKEKEEKKKVTFTVSISAGIIVVLLLL